MSEVQAPTLRVSQTVGRVFASVADAPEVSSWALLTKVLEQQPDYGGGRGHDILAVRAPAGARAMSLRQWQDEVTQIVQPEKMVHGRLLLAALARLDPILGDYLQQLDFLRAVEFEIPEQPVSSLFREGAAAPPRARVVADRAPLHIDSPATQDALGRRTFARALAYRLNRVWHEYSQSTGRTSFMMHLHGPWGSGKSSLLRMLRTELQAEGGAIPTGWMVVEFNAWQHQRLDPPWWPLLTSVYRQSREQLARRGFRRHALALKLRESVWRIFTLHRDLLVLLAFASVVIAAALVGMLWLLPDVQANAIAGLIGLGSAAVGFITVFGRTLMSGSATAAQGFITNASDPFERIAEHFRMMAAAIDRPILVMIDDLDRCQPAYAVRLLEGIQTLFGTSRVMYVVAADRTWLHTSFEKAYADLTAVVREPGRPLGALFLEKAFELSVSLPPVTEPAQKRYWQSLLDGRTSTNGNAGRQVLEEDRRRFAAATSEAEIAQLLSQSADDERRQQRLQLAVERMAHATFARQDELFLERFAELLEPNPRAMKRVLNAYAIQRDLALLRNIDVLGDRTLRTKLALWTILALRWPMLGEYLMSASRGRRAEASDEVTALLRDRNVRAVIEGQQYGAALDLETIAAFEGWYDVTGDGRRGGGEGLSQSRVSPPS